MFSSETFRWAGAGLVAASLLTTGGCLVGWHREFGPASDSAGSDDSSADDTGCPAPTLEDEGCTGGADFDIHVECGAQPTIAWTGSTVASDLYVYDAEGLVVWHLWTQGDALVSPLVLGDAPPETGEGHDAGAPVPPRLETGQHYLVSVESCFETHGCTSPPGCAVSFTAQVE